MSPAEPYASLRWPSDIAELDAKRALASTAATAVGDALTAAPDAHPRVGLGSGSTSFLTLVALADRRADLPDGVAIVATSYEMEWYATAAGFPVVDLGDRPVVVAFDGADQVDPDGALVKGRGGAMRRERAVLAAAGRELIVVDTTKRVPALGGCPVPLELDPSRLFATVRAVESAAGVPVDLRHGTGKDGPVITESGGVLADLVVPHGMVMTADLDAEVRRAAGVRDTGYFAPSPKRTLIEG